MTEHILLTGEPHAGKSTLLKRVLAEIEPPKHGFWTEEITVAGIRNGFKMITHENLGFLLATTQLPTPIQVSRYFVQLANLEEVVRSLHPLPSKGMLYLDEIGQMQLHSEAFSRLVRDFLASPLPMLGTISQVYEHPLIEEIKKRNDLQIITVTPENRDQLVQELAERFKRI